jgi:hypothetical protein
MKAYHLTLTNSAHQSFKTVINGVTMFFDLKGNSRTRSFFCTVRLADGTTIISGKELADKRLLSFNSNSTVVGGVLLTVTSPYTFPNIENNALLTVVV